MKYFTNQQMLNKKRLYINLNKYVLREGTSQVSLINYHDVTK